MFWFLILCIGIGAVVLIPEVRKVFGALVVLALVGFAVLAALAFLLYLLLARH